MGWKPQMLVVDCVSGYIDMRIAELLGDDPKPHTYTALRYNEILGPWHRDFRVMTEIQRRHGITIAVVGHTEHIETWKTIGYDTKGQPIRDGNPVGWDLVIPGKGGRSLRAAFSEVWHLVTLPNEAGFNATRKLFTDAHEWQGLRFDSKTRKGIKGPLTNPTWESIMKALPAGKSEPETILLLGVPGAGKTTLLASAIGAKKQILFLDLMGGCEELQKIPGFKVLFPRKGQEFFDTLKRLRDTGEIPD